MGALYKKLIKYSESDFYPFHMPGGKRNPELAGTGLPYQYDISEIEGFDDLHHANGLIKELEERASNVYHSEETALLINGSTSGLLSAIMGCTSKGDKVLVGRNSHKSIYHGLILNELNPIYLYSDYDKEWDFPLAIDSLKVEQALEEHPDIKGVILTSPTFEGVVSDIKEIVKIVHSRKIPLILDEAHGAHFGFSDGFPENANRLGVDLVIHSVHKTLPALTQTALIHKNGNLVDWERVRFYLQIFQSSSPSYILMSSIDVCISILENEESRKRHFGEYQERLEKARKRLRKLSRLKLIETESFDPSKILISTKRTKKAGLWLYRELLEKYHLQMEMTTGTTALAMTSIADTDEGMERLVCALEEIDGSLKRGEHVVEEKPQIVSWEFPKLEQVLKPSEAIAAKEKESLKSSLPFSKCKDKISCEFVYLYPPGIPLIVPGEEISAKAIDVLLEYEGLGHKVKGIKTPGKIFVLE